MRYIVVAIIFTKLLLVSSNVIGASADSKEQSTQKTQKTQNIKTAQTSNKRLNKSHKSISKKYNTVPHLKASDVIKMDKSSYVIFDVREKDEYAVSHLEDAIRVDPSIDSVEFYDKFSQQIADKTVIVYCSVGARSSKLAAELLEEEDELKVYNLENGIFGWHNESRPLFNSAETTESTEFVHPYNRTWGRLINRKELSRYKVEKN